MAYETILTNLVDGVLVLTMNRPERLNAWTYQMGAELTDAIVQGNTNEDVIAIVLTGAGRGFCAGADIGDVFKAQAEGDKPTRTTSDGTRQTEDWVALVRRSKPLVAAINGAAIGVGLSQVLPMDALIAAEGAKLSARFIKMGVVPELASSHFLPMRVGFGAASDLMLTGKTITAEQALELGMIDQVVAPDELLDQAIAKAASMGSNPQAALVMVKQLLSQNMGEGDIMAVQKRELSALAEAYKSPEHKEAISAFLEKREPDFKAARRG